MFRAAYPKLWYAYHLRYAKDFHSRGTPELQKLIYFFMNIDQCKAIRSHETLFARYEKKSYRWRLHTMEVFT